MPRERPARSRAARRESADGTEGTKSSSRARPRPRASDAPATKRRRRPTLDTTTKRSGADAAPSTSGRSERDLREWDVISALGERAVSNSVPADVLAMCADEDEDRDGGCSEFTSSQGTSVKTSSLRARRSLPGLRLPNEAFDGDRGDEGEVEIESGLAEAQKGETNLPADGWIQRCFCCSMLTWQNVCIAGFKVYRCSRCANSFRARAAAMASQGADAGEEQAPASNAVLASLMTKLRAVVDQVGGEHLKGSIIEG